MRNGAKVQLTATSEPVLNRYVGFIASRKGPADESVIAFDGSKVTLSNQALGKHVLIPVEGANNHADGKLIFIRRMLRVRSSGPIRTNRQAVETPAPIETMSAPALDPGFATVVRDGQTEKSARTTPTAPRHATCFHIATNIATPIIRTASAISKVYRQCFRG